VATLLILTVDADFACAARSVSALHIRRSAAGLNTFCQVKILFEGALETAKSRLGPWEDA
jgi:hypothetical protein